MKMKRNLLWGMLIGATLSFTSCVNDLDVTPIDPDEESSKTVYDSPEAYYGVLAKLYGGLALTGQQGPAGQGDIGGIDEGVSSYLRGYWYHQELTTDEAVVGWSDQTIKDFHEQDWGAGDIFIRGMYSRIFYQIVLANELIGASNGNSDANIQKYNAEARFLRALSYWHALDLFGNVPFVTEADKVGSFFPKQATKAELFAYIESELKDIETKLNLPTLSANLYGRANQAAAWALLAKLYLNAQVYIGQPKYTEAITYCNKIIASGIYSLNANYHHNFLADNHTSKEFIFTVNFDGARTQSYGGTTFIINAAGSGPIFTALYGYTGGWAGTRTTRQLVEKFPNPQGTVDKRALFWMDGHTLDINDVGKFTDGYAVIKFQNKTSTGANGSNATFPDTDFPMFRLADIYLMYAEAVLRGGTGGSKATAVNYINMLRERAYGNTNGNISEGDLTLEFILDERARELYWECHRRTDLIRFGQFTNGDYVWAWKGGVAGGIKTDPKYNIFPIPSADLNANPNLKQNPGY
ncbi:MAG: RagB/SusD family nutrient uptake outer membrane protein [Flammeovirgaceae bacterium]